MFILGPKYLVGQKNVLVLLHFLFGTAKLAIWKTRKNKMLGKDTLDPLLMFFGLVASRLRIEHGYYKLVGCLPIFVNTWAIMECYVKSMKMMIWCWLFKVILVIILGWVIDYCIY